MRISFLLLLLHLSLYLSAQRTYYVSGKGNDKNPGSMTSPFRSIKKVNTLALRPGDQVFFKSGEIYTGNLFPDSSDGGTKEAPAQIVSYGNGPATIAAGKKTAILVQDAGGIVIENLVVKGIGYAANEGNDIAVVNTLPENKRLNYGWASLGIFLEVSIQCRPYQ